MANFLMAFSDTVFYWRTWIGLRLVAAFVSRCHEARVVQYAKA
jgi:hypothetical protein